MLYTGNICGLTGSYRTTCACGESLEVVIGTTLPFCIGCKQAVGWVYLHPLVDCPFAASPAEREEIEVHIRKLRDCLRVEGEATDPSLLFALGKSLIRLGRIGPALEALYGALDYAPTSAAIHLELGKALLAYRCADSAQSVLERGIHIALSDNEKDLANEMQLLLDDISHGSECLNRRPSRRVPLNIAITRSDGLAPGIYETVNISETGICVLSAREQCLDEFAALDFRLGGRDIHVYARVMWCRNDLSHSSNLPYTIGLQFLNPSASALEAIATYVRRIEST